MNEANQMNKILDRLNKILAIAHDDRAPEAEAETALRMAHTLMSKHNLSLLDVEQHKANGEDNSALQIGELHWKLCKTFKTWHKTILSAVCTVHYCRLILAAGSGEYILVGTRDNALAAQKIAGHIMQVLRAASKPYGHGSNSFLMGASLRLHQKASQIVQYNTIPGKDLIVLSKDMSKRIDNYVQQKLQTRKVKMTLPSVHSHSAFSAGKEFASNLDMQRGIK